MTPHYLAFDPATIEKRQVYRLLTGAVVPRPIGWASTVSKSGVSNLAPFSFFTVVCVIPPMISLTIARNPDGTEKNTLKNVRETGEFCFNVVTEPVWREMVDSANAFPASDSEFSKTGLTPIPSVKIAAPRVKEVRIHFECKLERGAQQHVKIMPVMPLARHHAKSSAPDIGHQIGHHGHEQHVSVERQARHVDHGAADIFRGHARLDHFTAVGLQHAFALHHALGERGRGIADVDLATADVMTAAVERGLFG